MPQVLVCLWLMTHWWGRKQGPPLRQNTHLVHKPHCIIWPLRNHLGNETVAKHCIICAPFRESWPAADMGVNSGKVLWFWILRVGHSDLWALSVRGRACYEPVCIYVYECLCFCQESGLSKVMPPSIHLWNPRLPFDATDVHTCKHTLHCVIM